MSARAAGGAGSVVVVSADAAVRQRLEIRLAGMRWRVRVAGAGAQAMALLEDQPAEAMLLDGWLPDLEVEEFAGYIRLLHPETDLVWMDGEHEAKAGWAQSSRRSELLVAVRGVMGVDAFGRGADAYRVGEDGSLTDGSLGTGREAAWRGMPELVGSSGAMQEVGRLVRMVAEWSTTVLIEGETGTGKEVVARAVHRLSGRAGKTFAVLNCAAIPEALLEAELFGYAKGAFTGAAQARVGRIEAADGGTLLLDEIGEMPVGMQAKILRFLESGEVQRVGENETTRVDVRAIAATHRPLHAMTVAGTFRLDLYHRLAVFPIEVPALRERMEDVPELAEHFLEAMGRERPKKRLTPEAMERLIAHRWPGNVRELMHVLERGAILAGGRAEIGAEEIRYRAKVRPAGDGTA